MLQETCMTTTPTGVRVVAANHLMARLLGHRDAHLRRIEAAYPAARIQVRGNEISLDGEQANQAGRLFEELIALLELGHDLDERSLDRSIEMLRDDERPSKVLTDEVMKGAKGRTVRPKTAGQKRYIDAIRQNVITFGLGPAGTGKSWLAVAMAIQALQSKQVQRMAKIDPYLRPLYDALYDMLEPEATQKLIERQTIEVAPLAFMRGRTLNNSFIILDEAQNTTPEQMKMFLTRIGFGSRVVVTGDTTQVDVPGGRSGLIALEPILTGIEGLAFVHLTSGDVVRHRIVADIVAAYERVGGTPNPDQQAAMRRG
jgi:phosphate starvation-inducible protein PhoH and related proteins